jgi:hypothetical protein
VLPDKVIVDDRRIDTQGEEETLVYARGARKPRGPVFAAGAISSFTVDAYGRHLLVGRWQGDGQEVGDDEAYELFRVDLTSSGRPSPRPAAASHSDEPGAVPGGGLAGGAGDFRACLVGGGQARWSLPSWCRASRMRAATSSRASRQ